MSETRWYHSMNGKAFGPVSEQGMRGMIKESKLGADDLIWTLGMERWEPVAKLKEDWLEPEPKTEPAPAPTPAAAPVTPTAVPAVPVAAADKSTGKVAVVAPDKKTGKVTLVNAPLPSVAVAAQMPLKPKELQPMKPGSKGPPVAKAAREAPKAEKEEPEKKGGLFSKWFKRS